MTTFCKYQRSWLCRVAAAVWAVCVAVSPARAQDTSDVSGSRFRVMPGFGLRAGTPQKVSAAVGVVLGNEWRSDGRDRSRNVAVFVEPGLAAGRGSVALVSEFGNLGSGGGIAASVLRTWKDPLAPLTTNRTYVGADVFIWPVFFLGPRVGFFRPVTGPSKKGWFVVVDFGIGL